MTATPLLDTALMGRRRRELALSARSVAEAAGITGTTLTSLEAGFGHEDLPLGTLVRLAEALGVTLDQLVPSAAPVPVAVADSDVGDALAEDVAALGAVLFATRTLTPAGALCAVLGWSLERLHAAEQALESEFARVGIALWRHGHRLSLARQEGAVHPATLERALREHLGREHVNITEARLLAHVAAGDAPTQPSNAERVAQGVLVNAGLITAGTPAGKGEARLVVSEDVRFSLLLDEDLEGSTTPRRRRRSPANTPDAPNTNAQRGRKEKRQP